MKKECDKVDFDELEIMDLDEDDAIEVMDVDIDEETIDLEQEIEEEPEEFEELEVEDPYVVPVVEVKDAALEEYDEAEEAFGSTKSNKDDDEQGGFAVGFINRLLHMDTMDKIIAGLGLVVLILAIVAVGFFVSLRSSEGQLAAFADSGKNLDNITLIGERGLVAVTDATMAKIDAENEEEEVEEEEEEEEENVTSVVVQLNFTSIQKDLKVKFTNKKTGKLLAGIPFVLELVGPGGKTYEWTDEDKDGIIYQKNIEGGEYKVTMKELEGEIYERYVIDTTAKKTTVKKEIAYEKVDVSDEILDESQVDASKEDTELGNTVESVLTDTVAWVPTKTEAAGKDYVEVKKADIVPPSTSARKLGLDSGYVMMMVAQEETASVTLNMTSSEVEVGSTVSLVATVTGGLGTVTWTSNDNAIATVDENGTITGMAAGTVTITATHTSDSSVSATCSIIVKAVEQPPVQEVAVTMGQTSGEVEVSQTLQLSVSVTGATNSAVTWSSSDTTKATVDANGVVTGVAAGNVTITATSQEDTSKTATCSVTVKEAAVNTSITLDKTTAEVSVGKDITLVATTVPTEGVSVKWTSSNNEIATVNNGKVTGVKAGTVTITATLIENGNETKTATCNVTVKAAERKVTLDLSKLEMVVGEEKTLKATVTGYTAESNGQVTFASSDKTIATVDDKGKIVAVKAGTAKITATNTEGGVKVEATCNITVKEAVGLKTKDGAEVYVLKGDKYVKATAADYDKADTKFYIYTDVYKYQGWQTIDGKTYYYTSENKKVTGEQVIMGAKYVFDNDGVLKSTTGIMGIDVSKWNGNIDWAQVKASGVNYVIIRCGYRGSSQGALIEDPKYKANIEGATKAGLKVGVYFFSQAIDEVEAVQEASMVLSLVKNYKISYPIFLDVEASGGRADNISKETRTAVCKAFCQTIQNSGYTAGIYANKTWLTKKIDTSQLGSYKIWLAQYASAPTYTGRYEMWQYKDSGSVPGISGHVDLNLSYLGY